MTVRVFKNRLGHEKFLTEFDAVINDASIIPRKGDIVTLDVDIDGNKLTNVIDSEVYVVNQTVLDYVHDEINLFVSLYDWED